MKNIPCIITLLSISFMISCTSDFIEPNLKGKNLEILSPPDGYRTTSLTNTFWWNELRGAKKYRVQIVDSSFSYIMRLVLDSAVSGTKFTYTLKPGTYQWHIRAENNSSFTDYSPARTLYIDSTASVANQTVILVSPANNAYSNQLTNTFKWNAITSATEYRFQLINMSTSSTVTDITVQTDSFSYTLPQGQFKWQVRAQNASSNSLYSSRIINIDNTPPGPPALTAPANGATLPNPVVLSWTRDVSASGDSLYIYADSLYVTTLAGIYTTNTTYNYTGVSTQQYYWRVKSVDVAGNWSIFSQRRKFIVQ